jgi:hypothetical protein
VNISGKAVYDSGRRAARPTAHAWSGAVAYGSASSTFKLHLSSYILIQLISANRMLRYLARSTGCGSHTS